MLVHFLDERSMLLSSVASLVGIYKHPEWPFYLVNSFNLVNIWLVLLLVAKCINSKDQRPARTSRRMRDVSRTYFKETCRRSKDLPSSHMWVVTTKDLISIECDSQCNWPLFISLMRGCHLKYLTQLAVALNYQVINSIGYSMALNYQVINSIGYSIWDWIIKYWIKTKHLFIEKGSIEVTCFTAILVLIEK